MNTKVLGAGSRTVGRHPGTAMRVSLLAIKHRRAILLVTNATRRATQLVATVKRAAANPHVQTEASSVVSSLVLAGKRAQRIGVANAPSDKEVAAQLRQAGRHASRALTAARRPRTIHRVVRTATIVTGAGALGGAAYAGWRAYGQPLHPTQTEAQATRTPESMVADPSSPQTPNNGATSTTETSETENDVE